MGAAYVFASEVALSPAALLTVAHRNVAHAPLVMVGSGPVLLVIAGPGDGLRDAIDVHRLGPQPFRAADSNNQVTVISSCHPRCYAPRHSSR